MNNQELVKKAQERAEEKAGFFVHLAVYLSVNTILVIINLVTNGGGFWAIWSIVGWGVGLTFHFLSVFALNNVMQNYIKNQTAKELEKLKE